MHYEGSLPQKNHRKRYNHHIAGMIGIVDCNNFFVSCERVFDPSLRGKPVVVLSSNDGCVCAASNEAKLLGIKRGVPFFQIRDICQRYHVAALSGNHRLYGDMSSRVIATISGIVPDIEVYSIDEAFLVLGDSSPDELVNLGHDIVKRILRFTGIPTCMGIAHTKTLAKAAVKFAKRYPGYKSVCAIGNDSQRRTALHLTDIKDVWGIGRRLSKRLSVYGITTALDFAQLDEHNVNSMVNVTGVRTWRELNNEPCIDSDIEESQQKQMCCSRSFGESISTYQGLNDAISFFAETISRRLRKRKQAARSVCIFIHTNAFRTEDQEQYFNSAQIAFDEATNDTLTIVKACAAALRSIYRRGYLYKKAGVVVTDLVTENEVQRSLFTDIADISRRNHLMGVIDDINAKAPSGHRGSVHPASAGFIDDFVKSDHRSRLYSTRLSDIIEVNV